MNKQNIQEQMKEEWRRKYFPTAQEIIDDVTKELERKYSNINKMEEK